MRIITKKKQRRIEKFLGAILYITVHGFKWHIDNMESVNKMLDNISAVADEIGGIDCVARVKGCYDELRRLILERGKHERTD